jgi:nucleoside-diphosphate-sugar epimerase
LISSGAVYGKQPQNLSHIPENYVGAPDPMDFRSAYGEGKRLAEHLCALYANQFGIQTMIVRCFTFVGPYMPLDASLAIGNFIRDGLKGGLIRVTGKGTPHRSYMYAADLVIWLCTILFKRKSCVPYNVGSDETVTIADLAKLVSECFEPKSQIKIEKNPTNGLSGSSYIPSIERVKHEFGLSPTIGLEDSIKRTIDWFCSIKDQ